MNKINILVFLLLTSCAGSSLPEFPKVEFHYVIDVPAVESASEELLSAIMNIEAIPAPSAPARCLKFLILNLHPYKIKFLSEVPIKECNGVGGYSTADLKSVLNWVEDVFKWAEQKKQCFKK